ncbi:hypothetical protein H0H93_005024 [Arthromyces matolae]|nr:hypothetical protein H0H93_005024 [Arthromyces matolae]
MWYRAWLKSLYDWTYRDPANGAVPRPTAQPHIEALHNMEMLSGLGNILWQYVLINPSGASKLVKLGAMPKGKEVRRNGGVQKDKIPRPPNAFILYRSHMSSRLLPPAPGTYRTQTEISRIISTLWRNESADIKSHFRDLALLKKAEHEARYPGYKYSPRRRSEREGKKVVKTAVGSDSGMGSAEKPAGPSMERISSLTSTHQAFVDMWIQPDLAYNMTSGFETFNEGAVALDNKFMEPTFPTDPWGVEGYPFTPTIDSFNSTQPELHLGDTPFLGFDFANYGWFPAHTG